MKKIVSFMLLFILTTLNTFAYTGTNSDNKIVQSLSDKIEKVILKKGESNRSLFIKKLSTIKYKSKDDRLKYIISEIINNLNNSTSEIELLIKNIESGKVSTNIENNKLSSLVLFDYYITIYNKLIDNNVYGQNGNFELGCGNYADKWNEIYVNEFKDLYNKSYDSKNVFLMDLIKNDLKIFKKYFDNICRGDAKINMIEYKDLKIEDYLDYFDNVYYSKMYIYFNNWYNNLYIQIKDADEGVVCHDVSEDWDNLSYHRINFLEGYSIRTNSKIHNKYLVDVHNKFKKLIKKECNGILIK